MDLLARAALVRGLRVEMKQARYAYVIDPDARESRPVGRARNSGKRPGRILGDNRAQRRKWRDYHLRNGADRDEIPDPRAWAYD